MDFLSQSGPVRTASMGPSLDDTLKELYSTMPDSYESRTHKLETPEGSESPGQPLKMLRGDDIVDPLNGTDEPTARRVGRKPSTREPESKRRAQNRAAQRAFRERKEKHLKELETRVAELESESRGWQNTSIALRSKLSALEEELNSYRNGRSGKPPTPTNVQMPDENGRAGFWFSYPFNERSTLTPNSDGASESSNTSAHQDTKGATAIPANPRKATSSYGGSPHEGPGSVGAGVPGPLSNVSSGPSTGSPSDPDEFCDQLSLACPLRLPGEAPSEKDVEKTKVKSVDSPAEAAGSAKSPAAPLPPVVAAAMSHPVHKPGARKPSLGFNFGYRDPLAAQDGEDAFDLPELITSEYSLFDPLEDMLNWPTDGPSTILAPGFPSAPAGTIPIDAARAVPRSALAGAISTPGSTTTATTATTTSQSASSDSNDDETVPATSQRMMGCFEVWDRICSHPKFGELDISNMCAELRSKAKCSDSGVVLPENDLEKILEWYQ